VIFKAVRDGRPYPDHGLSTRDWVRIPPRQVRLDELVTTKRELALDRLLDEDSTFYGDLFPHAVLWNGDLYLEDGLHRALRAALQQRNSLHVRVLNLDGRTEAETDAAVSGQFEDGASRGNDGEDAPGGGVPDARAPSVGASGVDAWGAWPSGR
jgi:Arc/MetJ family transcription regulator